MKESIFVSDVHLGLALNDPKERETRFLTFLKDISAERTQALYLLGDIWDFWYEYRDLVPREGARIVAQFIRLIDEGVKIYFFEGNHDMWTYSFFEELGLIRLTQPCVVSIADKKFCLGHGDGLGGASKGYAFMTWLFHNKIARALFSSLHPWFAFRLGQGWSGSNRRSHKAYHFQNENEPLYRYAAKMASKEKIDYFIFGHYHDAVDLPLGSDSRFVILKDWIEGGMPCAVFNGSSFELRY